MARHTGLARARDLAESLAPRSPRVKGHGVAGRSGVKRVLAAGGAGFLGSHICELLVSRGHRITCLDNLQTGATANLQGLGRSNRLAFVRHDVTEPLAPCLDADEVYNLACATSPPWYQADPVQTMMTCVVGTNRLLAFAERCGARFLQASTSEIYGDPEMHPQREDYWGHVNPTGPRACYDEGKRAGRLAVRVARIFNTYGPRMQPDDGRIVSNLVCQALAGTPLTIYGTGEQMRSFRYVSDLVRGPVALMETPDGVVNIGNPGKFTINEFAALLVAMTGSASPVVRRPLPEDDPRRRRPDIERAARLLGWQPRVPLEDGLKATFAGEPARARPAAPGRLPCRTVHPADALEDLRT